MSLATQGSDWIVVWYLALFPQLGYPEVHQPVAVEGVVDELEVAFVNEMPAPVDGFQDVGAVLLGRTERCVERTILHGDEAQQGLARA